MVKNKLLLKKLLLIKENKFNKDLLIHIKKYKIILIFLIKK